MTTGDPTGAAEHYQAGLAIVRRLTEAHLDVLLPELARSLTSLGVVLTELGRHDEAQALDREALTIYLRLHAQHGDRPDEFRTDRGRGCTRARRATHPGVPCPFRLNLAQRVVTLDATGADLHGIIDGIPCSSGYATDHDGADRSPQSRVEGPCPTRSRLRNQVDPIANARVGSWLSKPSTIVFLPT